MNPGRKQEASEYMKDKMTLPDYPEIAVGKPEEIFDTPPPSDDLVIDPPYYQMEGYQLDDVLEAWQVNRRRGNAIYYIMRAPFKGKPLEDLKKAQWYINKEIEKLEEGG